MSLPILGFIGRAARWNPKGVIWDTKRSWTVLSGPFEEVPIGLKSDNSSSLSLSSTTALRLSVKGQCTVWNMLSLSLRCDVMWQF